MLDILALIAPVFGLIGLGFLTARSGYMEPGAGRILASFGYKVAMPALLFRAMAAAGPAPVSPLWLAAAYVAGISATWMAATLLSLAVLRRPRADAPAIAMAACFSNGVMLGFPVILLALGPEATTPMAFLATCETIVLWLVGTAHMSLAKPDGRGGLASVLPVARDVATNPLIIALIAGLAWRAGGLPMPAVPGRLMELLASAAIPVSLLALGMALSTYPINGEGGTVAVLCLVKLVAYPALAFWLATAVLELPRAWAGALVIYVAMPVGANAFLFASLHGRAVGAVSGAIAVSTLASVVTVTLALAFLKTQGIVVTP